MRDRGRAKAKQVCRHLHLRGRVNLEQLTKAYGIKIDLVEFRGTHIQEITIGNRIAVRRDLSDRWRRWVIAHGIGHVLLHREGNHAWLHMNERHDERDKYEEEAEAFAHELLIGSDFFWRYRTSENSEMAAYYGVPEHKVASHPLGIETIMEG